MIEIINIYSGAKLLDQSLESFGLIRVELPELLANIKVKEWKILSLAIIKSFRGEYGFGNYLELVMIYKKYAEIVANHYKSKWILSHILYQDLLVERFSRNIEEIFNLSIHEYTQGIYC